MSTHPLKHSLYQSLAKVAQALASANRLQLLEFVAQRERGVEEVAAMAGLSVANASQHLQALRQAGLVTPRKVGQRVYYSIAGSEVVKLYTALRRAGEERVAEVERLVRDYVGHRDELEPILAKELLKRLMNGMVTILDVRPPEEFAAGHLPGAINIPLEKLDKGLSKLPKKREIVAYCRGPYCLMAFDAVQKLRARGWNVRRLSEGFPEWKAAGLPVEKSTH